MVVYKYNIKSGGYVLVVLFFSEINKPIDFGDRAIEIFNSVLVPVYKDGKRVLTYKLDLENDEDGELSFAEIAAKKGEISDYKHIKSIESEDGILDVDEIFETFYGYVKKGVKRLGFDPEEFIASEGNMAFVTNMAIFDEDEFEESGSRAVSYWSKYRIAKIKGNRAVWFNSLISEDEKMIESFYEAGAELVELEEIAMDSGDPFSFVKCLGIDFEKALTAEDEQSSAPQEGKITI